MGMTSGFLHTTMIFMEINVSDYPFNFNLFQLFTLHHILIYLPGGLLEAAGSVDIGDRRQQIAYLDHLEQTSDMFYDCVWNWQ